MAAPRKPQDRKPKAVEAPNEFTFEHKDVIYTLPAAETVASLVGGRLIRDAAMEGESGQLRLAFFMLEKLELDPELKTLDVLYDLPAPEMLRIVEAWMQFKPATGVSLGE